MKYSVVIPGAGKSERFKQDKILTKINGEYIINSVVYNFALDKECEKIILVVRKDQYNKIKFMFRLVSKVMVLCINSLSRSESVVFGLSYCYKSEYVIIHDACRPYIKEELINDVKTQLLNGYDVVVPIIPIVDSIINIDKSLQYVNRNNYKRVQTPQGFRTKLLIDAFNNIKNKNSFNDEMSLILEYKNDINYKLIKGDIKNKKITFIDDLN